MPIIYNENILDMLRDKGYSTYKLRKDKIISESTLQKIRENKPMTTESIAILCELLECQPGDLMRYEP